MIDLFSWFWKIIYKIDVAICRIVQYMYQMFEVFAGTAKIKYRGERMFFFEVFLNQTKMNNIYWGIAGIGIVLLFAFTVAAVIRKTFDIGEKIKSSYGQILGSAAKGLLLILLMNAIVTGTFSISSVLIQQLGYIFQNADTLSDGTSISYSDQAFATMARVLDTIGNYSLNPSYNSRYNVNSCFNEIREDMQLLQKDGVFVITYPEKGDNGFPYATWQKTLERIARSRSLSKDISLEYYDESLMNAMVAAMETIQQDASLTALEKYSREDVNTLSSSEALHMDYLLFMSGTLDAALNEEDNKNPGVNDGLRGAYMTGQKDMYDWDTVTSDFDYTAIHYLITAVLAVLVGFQFVSIIINCIARIFNMLFLYLSAPPFIATMPIDEGGKFKQWMTAFIVQSFNIFGSIIAMQLLMLIVPILFSAELVIFDSAILNFVAKIVVLLGISYTADAASGIFGGILADNAGLQSIQAGNIGNQFGGSTKGFGVVAGVAKGAAIGAVSGVTSRVMGGAQALDNMIGASAGIKHAWNKYSPFKGIKKAFQDRVASNQNYATGMSRGLADFMVKTKLPEKQARAEYAKYKKEQQDKKEQKGQDKGKGKSSGGGAAPKNMSGDKKAPDSGSQAGKGGSNAASQGSDDNEFSVFNQGSGQNAGSNAASQGSDDNEFSVFNQGSGQNAGGNGASQGSDDNEFSVFNQGSGQNAGSNAASQGSDGNEFSVFNQGGSQNAGGNGASQGSDDNEFSVFNQGGSQNAGGGQNAGGNAASQGSGNQEFSLFNENAGAKNQGPQNANGGAQAAGPKNQAEQKSSGAGGASSNEPFNLDDFR